MESLLQEAQEVYKNNFPLRASFERAVFFSWGCTIGDCQFCYMSTQPEHKKPTETRRSYASIFAEVLLCKHLHWDFGFFTGGIGAFTPDEIEFMLKIIYEILDEKIWLSIGPVARPLLQRYQPYIKGVVGSTETINPELHAQVCPSKPLAPYERMFEHAKKLGLQRAMTFIVGLGETREDLFLLKNFIQTYGISKIHIYGLIPVEGTVYRDAAIPSAEEQAWWIAQLRIYFPALDIQAGMWEDRVERVSLLLSAGANSLSKYPALRTFGKPQSYLFKKEVEKSGRVFTSNLLHLPNVNWGKEVDVLEIDKHLKEEIKQKLLQYIKVMSKSKLMLLS